MKSKHERIVAMTKKFIKNFGGNVADADQIISSMNNPFEHNEKLSTEERTLICMNVAKHMGDMTEYENCRKELVRKGVEVN